MLKFSKYRVVVVEDEPKIRRNIVQKIEDANLFFEVVGTASNGEEAISIIKSVQPDVVFTDIKMPKMDGLELVKQIRNYFPEIQIVILSGYSEFEYAKSAMKMGVREYLLKPLKIESLLETLSNIRTNIEMNNSTIIRNILSSDIHGYSSISETFTSRDDEFLLFLICIGNLCPPITSIPLTTIFQNNWLKFQLSDIVKSLQESDKWWVIDEKTPNQKFLLISGTNRQSEVSTIIAEDIKQKLLKHNPTFTINICHNGSIIKLRDIWEKAQALRFTLDCELVVGNSSVISLTNEKHTPKKPILVDQLFRNKMASFIQSGEKSLLRNEILQLFNSWDQLKYPQRLLEKATNQLIRTIYIQTGTLSEEEIYQLEYRLHEKLAISSNFPSIFEDFWEIVERMLILKKDDESDIKKIIDQIAEFIRLNFTEFINFEEIAQKYHFTPAYLSKTFKKLYGETPLKFLIKLRIEEAKRLLQENPLYDIGKIGGIIGYSDQHYFSRIFKNSTGKSPTEYREQIR